MDRFEDFQELTLALLRPEPVEPDCRKRGRLANSRRTPADHRGTTAGITHQSRGQHVLGRGEGPLSGNQQGPQALRPIRVDPCAHADLIRAGAWYDSQRPGLGDRFLHEVERALIVATAQVA